MDESQVLKDQTPGGSHRLDIETGKHGICRTLTGEVYSEIYGVLAYRWGIKQGIQGSNTQVKYKVGCTG